MNPRLRAAQLLVIVSLLAGFLLVYRSYPRLRGPRRPAVALTVLSSNQPAPTADEMTEYGVLLRVLAREDYGEESANRRIALDLLSERNLPEALPALLRDTTPEERRHIATGLGRTHDSRVVPALIDLFRDNAVGLWASSALVELGEDAIEPLWTRIPVPPEEPEWPSGTTPTTVVGWYRSTLTQMGERAIPFLLARVRGGDPASRRKALSVLGRMYYRTFFWTDWPPELVTELRALTNASDAATRLWSLEVLRHIDPVNIGAFAAQFTHDPNRYVAGVAQELSRGGNDDECRRVLTRVKRDLDAGRLDRAASNIRSTIQFTKGSCDAVLVPGLIPYLKDTREEVRSLAVETLQATSSPPAERALGEAWQTEPSSVLRATILENSRPGTIRVALQTFDQQDQQEQQLIIEALGRNRIREAIPVLARRFGDPTMGRAAIRAMGSIGESSGLPPLMEAFQSTLASNTGLRAQAVASIATLGGLQAVQFLGQLVVKDPSRDVRVFAAQGVARAAAQVGKLKQVQALVRPVIASALNDTDEHVRESSVEMLRVLGDVQRLADLVKNNVSIPVRVKARYALETMCDPAALRVLIQWTADSERQFQLDALHSLSHVYQCEADQEFGRILRDEAGPRLIPLLQGSDAALAQEAGSALGWIHDPPGLDAIIREFDRRPELRLSLACALYNYGPSAEKAVPVLRKARPDASADLAVAIDQVLGRFVKR